MKVIEVFMRKPSLLSIRTTNLPPPHFRVWFDGACEPNPGGPAGYGVVIEEYNEVVAELSGRCSQSSTSNNVAEYMGLHAALDWFIKERLLDEVIEVYGDSKLVIEQIFGT